MDLSTLPVWAQNAGMIAIALISTIIGVFKYLKTETKNILSSEKGEITSAISASFIDSKLLKELIDSIRELQDEQGRDAKKAQRLSQDLRESVNELNESIIVQTDTTMNLVRFINRENNKQKFQEN